MSIKQSGPNVNKFSMNLLKWKEITTKRQKKNGTRIFQLPIKKYGQYIEVGSFESGYVRRMNGGYTPYQLNKCESIDYYYFFHISLCLCFLLYLVLSTNTEEPGGLTP